MPRNHGFEHYKGSDLPTAMEYPAYDPTPDDTLDLSQLPVLGERRPSDAEIVAMVRAYNDADGALPRTRQHTLLQDMPDTSDRLVLAHAGSRDEGVSNGILYLKTDKFVYAVGMQDFTNGREDSKGGQSSREVIQRYKNMSARTVPPATMVTAYVEAGGNTYYSLGGDGTHRLAAAKLRGDAYMPVSDVTFVALDDNRITEQLAELERQAAEVDQAATRGFGSAILRWLGKRS